MAGFKGLIKKVVDKVTETAPQTSGIATATNALNTVRGGKTPGGRVSEKLKPYKKEGSTKFYK